MGILFKQQLKNPCLWVIVGSKLMLVGNRR